jgi:hypothetical protein
VDGEFGRLLGWVAELGLRGLVGCLLLSLPVMAFAGLGWFHRLPHLRSYWRVPIITWPAMSAGAALAWCILYADPFGPSFRISAVFEVGGPWDIPWTTFLTNRADPALYGYEKLLPVLRTPDIDPSLALALLSIGVLLVIAVVAALVYLRDMDLAAGLLGIPFLVLFSQAVTIYVTALFAYTLNTLNFWAALVALAVLQYYRHLATHGGR